MSGKKHIKAAEKLKQSGQASTIDINAERKRVEQQEKDKHKPLAQMVWMEYNSLLFGVCLCMSRAVYMCTYVSCRICVCMS